MHERPKYGLQALEDPVHNDVAFIALTVVFFVLAGLLTIACDRIIGPDPVETAFDGEDEREPERLAA